MFKLILFFTFAYSSLAYITKFPDFWYLENFNYSVEGDEEQKFHNFIEEENYDLWALDIDTNILDALKLRKATKAEKYDFETAIGPMIISFESNPRSRVAGKKVGKQRNKTEIVKDDAVEEIMRIVNKFVLSAVDVDTDVHLPQNDDEYTTPKLALFFKGAYSALVIKYGNNEWRFFISPPSPLPHWFYEDHKNSSQTQEVPKDVEKQFYGVFLRLLKIFLRFDL